MSTAAFRLMIATTEFQNKARQFLAPNVSYANLSLADVDFQRTIALNVLGLDVIELDDSRAWKQMPDGRLVSEPYLPINKIILGDPADDGDPNVMDFANGPVVEAMSRASWRKLGRPRATSPASAGARTATSCGVRRLRDGPPDAQPAQRHLLGRGAGLPAPPPAAGDGGAHRGHDRRHDPRGSALLGCPEAVAPP